MVSKVLKGDKEVLVVDYSDCNETKMLELVMQAKQMMLLDNKPLLLLSIYNDRCFATPKFMMAVKKETPEVIHLISKQAVVGLSQPKKLILKGYNFLFQRNIRTFDTKEEAIDFLIDVETTDKDIPEYW